VLQIAYDASSAIMHLHHQNIVHRDVSARNFLVNSYNRCFISDFGMSVALESKSQCYAGDGNEPVPIAWCAPEVLNTREFSKESDVYAFGIFLFELFSHSEPYAGMKLLSGVAPGVVNTKDPLRPNVPGYLPAPVKQLLKSCWHPRYDERPSMDIANERLKALHDTFEAAKTLKDVGVSFADSQKGSVSRGAPTDQHNRYDSYQVELPGSRKGAVSIQRPHYYERV